MGTGKVEISTFEGLEQTGYPSTYFYAKQSWKAKPEKLIEEKIKSDQIEREVQLSLLCKIDTIF